MILTLTPNPCVDKTLYLGSMEVGEKNVSRACSCVPGGKGVNVTKAVRTLGGEAAAVIIAGGPPGQHVVDMLEEDGLPCVPVWVEGMTRTITTVLEEPIHRQTPLFEPGPHVTQAEKDNLINMFADTVRNAAVVTFNGTVPDPILEDLYRDLVPLARRAGAITVLDSHGAEFALALESEPDMVKPNTAEAGEIVGFDLDTDAKRWRAVDFFHDKGVKLVVLSLGKDGVLVSDGQHRLHAMPPKIKEVNAVGSGDALVAAFAVGLRSRWPLEKMARIGVAAGAANAQSWDIGHFSRNEVDALEPEVRIEARQ